MSDRYLSCREGNQQKIITSIKIRSLEMALLRLLSFWMSAPLSLSLIILFLVSIFRRIACSLSLNTGLTFSIVPTITQYIYGDYFNSPSRFTLKPLWLHLPDNFPLPSWTTVPFLVRLPIREIDVFVCHAQLFGEISSFHLFFPLSFSDEPPPSCDIYSGNE